MLVGKSVGNSNWGDASLTVTLLGSLMMRESDLLNFKYTNNENFVLTTKKCAVVVTQLNKPKD